MLLPRVASTSRLPRGLLEVASRLPANTHTRTHAHTHTRTQTQPRGCIKAASRLPRGSLRTRTHTRGSLEAASKLPGGEAVSRPPRGSLEARPPRDYLEVACAWRCLEAASRLPRGGLEATSTQPQGCLEAAVPRLPLRLTSPRRVPRLPLQLQSPRRVPGLLSPRRVLWLRHRTPCLLRLVILLSTNVCVGVSTRCRIPPWQQFILVSLNSAKQTATMKLKTLLF